MPGRQRLGWTNWPDVRCSGTDAVIGISCRRCGGGVRSGRPGGLGTAPLAHARWQCLLQSERIQKCRGRRDAQDRPSSRRLTAKACPASLARVVGMAPSMSCYFGLPALRPSGLPSAVQNLPRRFCRAAALRRCSASCACGISASLHVIARLAALVSKPRVNLTRSQGVFAPTVGTTPR